MRKSKTKKRKKKRGGVNVRERLENWRGKINNTVYNFAGIKNICKKDPRHLDCITFCKGHPQDQLAGCLDIEFPELRNRRDGFGEAWNGGGKKRKIKRTPKFKRIRKKRSRKNIVRSKIRNRMTRKKKVRIKKFRK
tara:strand:+ start:63 stop:470 length:408 start_codon:yes stop_codon:yes gene_type:complete